jgi:predicted dehydrogenase
MIGVAVIGVGQWGPNLLRNFHDGRRSEVRWAIDPDRARLDAVRARFPEIVVSSRPDAALADPGVDAVVVATPTTTHHALASAALGAGKHVLIEKPITAESRQGEELCALAERAGAVLMVGHVFLYNDAIRRVKEYLDEGRLGRIYYASAVRTSPGPVRTDVNAGWDLAAHDCSILGYWLDAAPVSAAAAGGAWIKAGVEDAVFATLRYPNGVLLHIHASWLSLRKTREITVVGEVGMLVFDDMNLQEPLRIYERPAVARDATAYIDSFASFRASSREGEITIPKVAMGEPLKAECDHFLDCIAEGRTPLTDGPSGVAVVRALEAIERSMRAGGREEAVAPPDRHRHPLPAWP